MLGPYGEADGSLSYALFLQFGCIELGVGGARRVYDQRFHISNICKQGEQLEVVDESFRFRLPAHYVKGEDRGSSLGEVLGIEVVVGIVREGRVPYDLHFGMAG